MFGCYRILLALMVVVLHYGGVRYIGEYAVFGFFALSGYLMTLIMQQNYGYTARGIGGYALNRFLRIYPIYWVVCLLSILILLALDPAHTTEINRTYYLPSNFVEWLKNTLLIQRIGNKPVLISPAWALSVELVYYFLIGLGLSRSRRVTVVWFVASILITGYMIVRDAGWDQRYFSITAATLPFSTGAMIYHWRDELNQRLGRFLSPTFVPPLFFFLIIFNWWAGSYLGTSKGLSFYANFALCAVMIIALHNRKDLWPLSKRADKWLGDLSYPIYLVHFPFGFLLLYWWKQLGFQIKGPGLLMFVLSIVPLILLSWFISSAIEEPIERLRRRVKSRV